MPRCTKVTQANLSKNSFNQDSNSIPGISVAISKLPTCLQNFGFSFVHMHGLYQYISTFLHGIELARSLPKVEVSPIIFLDLDEISGTWNLQTFPFPF